MSAMTFETILVETKARVGLIRFNRPKALNALNVQMIAEMNQALSEFDADPLIAVVILTGSDKAFAAGADIREMKDKSFAELTAENFLSDWDHINSIGKPVIAAVAGYAFGGGFEFALASDIIIAADTAKFAFPEVTLGIMPGGGGTQRLVRTIGKAKAMEMILTGRMMEASEAERLGVVARIVAPENLIEEAFRLAEKIAGLSNPVVAAAKRAISAAFEEPLSRGLALERQAFHALFDLEDQKEGMAAFLEKRPPVFRDK